MSAHGGLEQVLEELVVEAFAAMFSATLWSTSAATLVRIVNGLDAATRAVS